MFIINLTYETDLDKVDKLLPAHIEYLTEQYQLGNFLMSGPKIPRTGGIILCRAGTIPEVQNIIAKDPFHAGGVAAYELIEFLPRKTSEELTFLQEG